MIQNDLSGYNTSIDEYNLAYEETATFLKRTVLECWWAEEEDGQDEDNDIDDENLKEESVQNQSQRPRLPAPLTPSVCSTSVRFLRHSMDVAVVRPVRGNRISPNNTKIPAFSSLHSPAETTESRHRRASISSQARRWIPIASREVMGMREVSSPTPVIMIAAQTQTATGHHIEDPSASSCEVYSSWNQDMAQLIKTNMAQHNRSSNSNPKQLWLQPPISGLPGGWSTANVVHATQMAMEQYIQHATEACQATAKSAAPKGTPSPGQDEDTIIYSLIHFILQRSTLTSTEQDSPSATRNRHQSALSSLSQLGTAMPRKVCQHPFKKNELVWVCRTCQSDETCVLCHACYQHSCHEGHDVSFYHAQAGGCCDCGDPEAWDPKGFCPSHGGGNLDTAAWKDLHVEARCGGVVKACAEWLMTHIASQVEQAYIRANPESMSSFSSQDIDMNEPISPSGNPTTVRSYSLPLMGGRSECPSSLTGFSRDTDPSTTLIERGNMKQSSIRKLHSVDGSTHELPFSTIGDINQDHDITLDDVKFYEVQRNSRVESPDDQVSFNPEAASTSKSRTTSNMADDDTKSIIENGGDSERQKFLSNVAGSSKVRSSHSINNSSMTADGLRRSISPAQYLGCLGSEQCGLYLILHADDIHTITDTTSALRSLYCSSMTPESLGSRYQSSHYYLLDTILTKIARLLNVAGDVIVYGTHELMAELGPVLSLCWKDGDIAACARFGGLMLDKAKILTRAGFVVSIKTRLELYHEVRAIAVIKLLSLLSESCDPLCLQVSLGLGGLDALTGSDEKIHGTNCLTKMLHADLKLPRMINSPWHSLLLLLLSNPVFKRELANSYCEVYSSVSNQYAKGIGLQDMSCFILSVQFLNRASFVQNLVQNRDLITLISRCLLDMFSLALKGTGSATENTYDAGHLETYYLTDPLNDSIFNPWTHPPVSAATDLAMGRRSVHVDNNISRQRNRLDPMHPVLLHKRYIPCVSDFKYVLNVKGMARIFSSISLNRSSSSRLKRKSLQSLDAFLETLKIGQYMDEQIWRKTEEGHVENETKTWVVAFNTSISLGSLSERLLHWEDDDPIPEIVVKKEGTITAFLSAVDLTHHVLVGFIFDWIRMETINMATTSHRLGLCEHDRSQPYMPFSTYAHKTVSTFKALPISQTSPWSFHLPLFRFLSFCLIELSRRPNDNGYEALLKKLLDVEGDHKSIELLRGLMEFIVLLLSRVSQIKAGLWRRNGTSMLDQILNYGETPFCRLFRDADIIILQFSLLGLVYSRNQSSDDCVFSQFIHLMINRYGLYNFVGLDQSHPVKLESDNSSNEAVWVYNPSNERSSCLTMLDDFLHTLIIMVTELPSPPVNVNDEVQNTTKRLRRELIHRLASGPKTHSELGEVIHILSFRDNEIMIREGKKINPDDAIGSLIQSVLRDVADCLVARGALIPDEYRLHKNAWAEYDPAFFHMSSMNHQVAAENRPCPEIPSSFTLLSSQPYSPPPPPVHNFFSRLRKDLTSDATVIAIVYRILHSHLSTRGDESIIHSDSKLVYNTENMSEIVLSRAVHILTLGAHVWKSMPVHSCSISDSVDLERSGSIFSKFHNQPSFEDWIDHVLLGEPEEIMKIESFRGEYKMLILLKRLGEGVSLPGKSIVRDKSIRCGALWLCHLASVHSAAAASALGQSDKVNRIKNIETAKNESIEYRMNEAKRRILSKMKVDIEKFTHALEAGERITEDIDDEADDENIDGEGRSFIPPKSADNYEKNVAKELRANTRELTVATSSQARSNAVKEIPQCVICAEENETKVIATDDTSSRILTFCAFIQSSTVLLGAGAVTSDERNYLDRFVGAHISLCGHAVHSSCCDSYLKALTSRDDRFAADNIRRSEFKCPLCQRVSNCLVPFVDVDLAESEELKLASDDVVEHQHPTLEHFLRYSKWWCVRNDKSVSWDGRCSFVPTAESQVSSPKRNTGKGDLYRTWDSLLSPYRLLTNKRRSLRPEPSLDIDGFEENSDHSTPQDISITSAADVWRRLIDVASDVTYRADLKRLGESELKRNFGEYRHYLVERHALNDELLAKSQLEWPQCLPFINTLTEQQRQSVGREKPIARLLSSIQTLTYTCCAESMEFRRLVERDTDSRSINETRKRFGISDFSKSGRVILLSTPLKEGRFGRLRYFILALLRATSALHREIVQLAVGFPMLTTNASLSNDRRRAPLTHPILCSHVLTHVTAVICSIAGVVKIPMDHDPQSVSWIQSVDVSSHFVALGLIARVLQTLLFHVDGRPDDRDRSHSRIRKREEEIISILSRRPTSQSFDEWSSSCRHLLLMALGRSSNRFFKIEPTATESGQLDEAGFMDTFHRACEKARYNAEQYLREALLILQLVLPPWSYHIRRMDESLNHERNSLDTLGQLHRLAGIAPFHVLLQSSLVVDIVMGWYNSSKENHNLPLGVHSQYCFRDFDWPLNSYPVIDHRHHFRMWIQVDGSLPTFPNAVPLIGLAVPSLSRANTGRPRLDAIPLSYTDLYAQVSDLLPNCELCAFCMVCGEVMNANGGGECTRHCYICGGGAGILFLLQECISLLIYKEKATYFHSPYVDSHGETHMSRGRPLNMDMERYRTLCSLYCGHTLRQQVISERSKSTRHHVIANFY